MLCLIQDYLDSVARDDPHRPAAWFDREALTYAELVSQSNQLANTLARDGVARHDRVGIYMEKGIKTPVALYGIMKAGAAYVPLDPAAPVDRVARVIRDCGISHVVSSPAKVKSLRSLSKTECGLQSAIGVDADSDLPFRRIDWDEVAGAEGRDGPDVRVLESDLAYIIYTSGSTGQPKGIMHTHHSGLSFARWAAGEYELVSSDRLSNHAPLHFDLSIFDYFAAVVAGASTVIIPEEYTKLPASYSQLLEDAAVTVLFTVPFALIQLSLRGLLEERDLSALRWAIFGGEPFPPNHLRDLMQRLPHVRFDNMYGPAEVNGCAHYTVTKVGEESIPIGPIAVCAEPLVIDADDLEVQRGEIGELLVRTPTMMQGYWQRPNLNEDAFYRRKNAAGRTEVFFRTGDLVQEQVDGLFRFVGRKDRQVKVRGFRIELDEIELALTSITGVEESAVYIVEDDEGGKEIRAKVTLRAAGSATPGQIAKALKDLLPWYGIPADISIVSEFPRTRTGKIDRRALVSEPDSGRTIRRDGRTAPEAARG